MISVETTPIKPRKVTASPVKLKVSGVISVALKLNAGINQSKQFILHFIEIFHVEDLTRHVLNLIPDASVEIHLFCVDECSMAADGHQWENTVPL